MDTPSEGSEKTITKSVVRRFNLALLSLYLLAIVISTPVVYYFTQQQAYAQAEQELGLMVDMINAIRGYVGNTLRPYFMEQKLFFAPGFSGVVAIADVAGHFQKVNPNYSIRTSSDNPLNPSNLPKPLEKALLDEFRDHPDLKEIRREGYLDGRRLLTYSVPMAAEKGCIKCHGDYHEVPREITEKFGTSSGYDYKLGQTVGINLVGVPIADINAITIKHSAWVIGGLTVLFGLIFSLVNGIVRSYLIHPVLELRDAVQRIARGELEQPVVAIRDDELGDLARSVELMRRSFAQAMKRLLKASP